MVRPWLKTVVRRRSLEQVIVGLQPRQRRQVTRQVPLLLLLLLQQLLLLLLLLLLCAVCSCVACVPR